MGAGASKAHGIIDGLSLLKGEWGPGVLSAPSSPRRGLCRPQRRAQKGLDPQPGLGELARILSFLLVSRSLGLRPSPLPGPPRPLAWGQQGRWEGIPTLSLLQAGGCCAPWCYSGRCSRHKLLLCCDVGFLRSWGGVGPWEQLPARLRHPQASPAPPGGARLCALGSSPLGVGAPAPSVLGQSRALFLTLGLVAKRFFMPPPREAERPWPSPPAWRLSV